MTSRFLATALALAGLLTVALAGAAPFEPW